MKEGVDVRDNPNGIYGRKATLIIIRTEEADVMGSPSLIVRTVSLDVKQL